MITLKDIARLPVPPMTEVFTRPHKEPLIEQDGFITVWPKIGE